MDTTKHRSRFRSATSRTAIGGVFVDSREPKLRMPASSPRLNVNITALSHAA
jgi:hypothetical protein